MAKIIVDSSEFGDIVASFLLDKLNYPYDVIGPEYNSNFNALMEIIDKKGLRPILIRYYLDMGPKKRFLYKKIQSIFRNNKKSQPAVIEIRQNKISDEKLEHSLNNMDNVIKKLTGDK